MSQMKSSLALQVLLNAAFTYSSIYFILMFLIFLYKATTLTYPVYIKVIEGLLIIEILPLEILKFSWARRGNLTETWAYLSLSMLLNILMGLICLYFMFFQAFVVALELYLTIIQSCFAIILLILHLITIILFVK
uniref:Transmembrane protein n=1 Tax=Strongyloides venezuelensis TaxID=75913 RepID=A0A0K0FG28_STRVS